jgi:hypothetical protein
VIGRRFKVDVGAPAVVVVVTETNAGGGVALSCGARPGTDVTILKIFSPKRLEKKLAFLTQNKAKLCKKLIITLVCERNAIFSPKIFENRGILLS